MCCHLWGGLHVEGLTIYVGGPLLTLAVQGLTKASKQNGQESRGKGDRSNENLGLTSWHHGGQSYQPDSVKSLDWQPSPGQWSGNWYVMKITTSSPWVMCLRNWPSGTWGPEALGPQYLATGTPCRGNEGHIIGQGLVTAWNLVHPSPKP